MLVMLGAVDLGKLVAYRKIIDNYYEHTDGYRYAVMDGTAKAVTTTQRNNYVPQ